MHRLRHSTREPEPIGRMDDNRINITVCGDGGTGTLQTADGRRTGLKNNRKILNYTATGQT